MAFKSSKGRDIGKEVATWQSNNIGQSIGGGAGGSASPVPFSATGGTKTEPGDGFIYHVFGHPNPGSNFVVATTNPEAQGGHTIEVYIQGNGGAGGGKSGTSSSVRSSGGGGGCSALWSVPITTTGTYPVTVCGGRGPRPGNTNPYSYPTIGDPTTRFTHNTNPSIYIQSNGGNNGGWNGSPSGSDGGSGNAVGASDTWTPEGAVLNYLAKSTDTPNSPSNPQGQPFQAGKGAGYYGTDGNVTAQWWEPYVPGGPSIGGNSAGTAGVNYGGGGGGVENGASNSGSGAEGRMVIRYPDSI